MVIQMFFLKIKELHGRRVLKGYSQSSKMLALNIRDKRFAKIALWGRKNLFVNQGFIKGIKERFSKIDLSGLFENRFSMKIFDKNLLISMSYDKSDVKWICFRI